MPRYSTAFGMDVHLRSTTVCALDAETGEAVTRRFRGNPWGEVAEWMSGFPGPSLAAYESGYLGFAPQRELSGLGVDCVVAAVSKVPRSAADLSSKNDRNDAARMAKAILSHDVTPVWVPSPEIEGLRDLVLASIYFSPFSPTYFRQSRQRGCAGFANADAPLSASRLPPPSRPHRRWIRPSGGTTVPLS